MENDKLSKSDKLKEILRLVEKYKITNYEISKNTGLTEAGLGKIMGGKTQNPRHETIDMIYKFVVGKYRGDFENLGGRLLDENFTVREPVANYRKNELIEKNYEGLTPVKVVSTKARAGWSDAYYSEEYLEEMPTILIETDENYKGDYLAFEVDNDSMEPEYFAGDVVICRKVRRHLWQYKLHYKDYDFVIAHSKGIALKEIIDHDVENGIITCHSINQELGHHPDFKLNLHEVAYLFNVVEVRQSGKSKKRRR